MPTVRIKSQPVKIVKDEILYMQRYGKVLSFSFKNQGITDVLINDIYLLPVGSSALAFTGEKDVYRADEIKLTFTGGTGEVIMWITLEA